jgi:hypothetical protein
MLLTAQSTVPWALHNSAMYWKSCLAGRVIDIPRGEAPGFKINVRGIQEAVRENKPKVLFLTSPNNPDGSIIDPEDIDELLKLPVLVILDEAYIEFCNSQESRMPDVLQHDNLVVLRTFSKRAGLAGESSFLLIFQVRLRIKKVYASAMVPCHYGSWTIAGESSSLITSQCLQRKLRVRPWKVKNIYR